MSKLSPSLNTRLANIEITQTQPTPSKSPRSPKKSYPASLYPRNHNGANATTPSKAPVLSTARRAQSRSLSSSKHLHESTNVSPERKSLKTATSSSTTNDLTEARSSRKPSGQNVQFLFMRETTSSKKKQLATTKLPVPSQSTHLHQYPTPQDRAVSHPEFYNKRPCTHSSSTTQNPSPVKKTNPSPDKINTDTKSTKHSLNPKLSFTRKMCHSVSTDNVYLRLYNDALKSAEGQPSRGFPRLTGFRLLSSALRQESSTVPQAPSKPKVSSLNEMYSILYSADKELFLDPHTLDPDMEPKTPILPHELHLYPEGQSANVYERGEIMRKQEVYFLANANAKNINVNTFNSVDYKNNFGFDDKNGNYLISLGDHIEYRYEIKQVLGTGSFGNVVLCLDHKYSYPDKQRKVAIKIIRNDLNWSLQAVSEIKMLKQLSQASKDHMNDHIMNYYDHFHFRGHMCIATEVLSLNLFTFLELLSFRGVNLELLKYFASDILKGLGFVHDQRVIHCDIKPENIMIELPHDYDPPESMNPSKFTVKLIDFGSSCFESDTSFSYIQSRFYRAPEVILGSKYSSKIDIWSLGCVLAELFTGAPILPGKSEVEQIALILELFGAPSAAYITNERKKLLRMAKMSPAKIRDPISAEAPVYGSDVGAPIDEKKIKRTLLYSLFNVDGKINIQYLNQLLLANNGSGLKKSVKLNARSLDVCLRLHNSGEAAASSFSRFMGSIFCWNPLDRPSAAALLDDPFMK